MRGAWRRFPYPIENASKEIAKVALCRPLLSLTLGVRTVEELKPGDGSYQRDVTAYADREPDPYVYGHCRIGRHSPPKPALIEVSGVASSALALFRGRILERRIGESVSVQNCYAYCSEGEIRQALVNLIGNAIDAMPDGGQLHLRVAGITVNGALCARLTVADTGSGIRREIRASLFTQFFTTKGSRGTGLGLWLTRDIVHRNGGHLRFRSRVEAPSGTVFSIYLPSAPSLDVAQLDASHSRGERARVEAA